jgi:hypothetical protein
VERE